MTKLEKIVTQEIIYLIRNQLLFRPTYILNFFEGDDLSNNISIDNSQENHIKNLTNEFGAISMSSDNDNSLNNKDNNINSEQTNFNKTNYPINKRKIHYDYSVTNKKQKRKYNSISSQLKR